MQYLIRNKKGSFLIDRSKSKNGWWARFETVNNKILMRFVKKSAAQYQLKKLTDVYIIDSEQADLIIKKRYLEAKRLVKKHNKESSISFLLQKKLYELDPMDLGQE